jgi:hypothetical protein
MDEVQKIKEIFKEQLKRWNSTLLHEVFDHCEKMYNETGNEDWKELTEIVRQEITDRGGRR